MDREVVAQKLESLRRCVARIQTHTPPDAQSLATDFDLQDILSLNMTRAVQLCVDIGAHLMTGLDVPVPDSMGQTFDVLAQAGLINAGLASNLKKSVGFRNIAVHNYGAVNWDIVFDIAKNHLTDFADFAKVAAASLDRQ